MSDPFAPNTIVSFFDVNNLEHLRAWKELESTGKWPEWFWPRIEGLMKPTMWQVHITAKLADAWVKLALGPGDYCSCQSDHKGKEPQQDSFVHCTCRDTDAKGFGINLSCPLGKLVGNHYMGAKEPR